MRVPTIKIDNKVILRIGRFLENSRLMSSMAVVQVRACGVSCSCLSVEAEPQWGWTGRHLAPSASGRKRRGEALGEVCALKGEGGSNRPRGGAVRSRGPWDSETWSLCHVCALTSVCPPPSSDSAGRSGASGALTVHRPLLCDWSARLLFPAVLKAGVPPPQLRAGPPRSQLLCSPSDRVCHAAGFF